MTSFTRRLALRFAALVTGTTAVVLTIGGWLLDQQMLRGFEVLHEVEFKEVQELFRATAALSPQELVARMREEAEKDAAIYYFQLRNAGELLFRSPSLGEIILPDLADSKPHWTATLPGVGPVLVSEFHAGSWHVQIGSALAPSRRLLRDYARIGSALVAGVMVVSIGLGYGFSRYTLRPVRDIEQTARRIRGDNLGERISQPEGSDELADLVRLLNQMFGRLEISFLEVRRFTADASHELKTPLALARLNAEKLRARIADDPEASDMLDEINEDLESLRQIIESLLFLARAESGSFSPALKEIHTEELVRDFAEDATAMAEEPGVIFRVIRLEPGTVTCEPTLVRQVLLNLVSNALRVTPRGGVIELESTLGNGWWRLAIRDEGPGLRDEQLRRVFERFIRFEPAGENRGHGLGLAICRSIAQLHGGRIEARNRKDRTGLCVTLELPVSATQSG
ncbi:MAG TPA: ATP-binding protein [Opitutus sp.]|nr:ATP-binding protein [Opitutus sp.]